ncbi:hypothetical protein F5X96DRAFT_680848 [Biscogniauxia mediterranea]|nr:hypothetical protein F5X96DRAFT_680848 [Biscogniauxia mediterranea]
MRGSSPSKNPLNPDSPEQLLDAFKAAALSVTKLYKTSAAAQSKARSDGYQDCLDDLLAFLDKQNIGVSDGEGWQVRRWATERIEGKDLVSPALESEDEVDKTETATSSPELHRSSSATQLSTMRTDSAPPACHQPAVAPIVEEPQMITVPTQESFTFQSSHPYPQESYLNLANLDLSDSTRTNDNTSQSASTASIPHSTRLRSNKRSTRPRPTGTTTGHLGRGAGQKRSINFAELFDVGGLGFGKDMFGRDGKRSRHT